MPFDIRQLRYAIAAADHGSFYRAARALDIDQSTLSRNILKLERVLNMPIFKRSRSGVTLTTAGQAFIHGAKPMVAMADKLVVMMRAAGEGRAGALRLGHNCSLSSGNLRATTMSWHAAQPDVEIECVEVSRQSLLAGLDTGDIDLAILMGTASYDGLASEKWRAPEEEGEPPCDSDSRGSSRRRPYGWCARAAAPSGRSLMISA